MPGGNGLEIPPGFGISPHQFLWEAFTQSSYNAQANQVDPSRGQC
jgi:hypothetical protein